MTRLTYKAGMFWTDEPSPGWKRHPSHGRHCTSDPVLALPLLKFADKPAREQLARFDMWRRLSGAKSILPQHFDLPPGEELKPYQEAGVYFLKHVIRGYLADEVGLGKTVMACAAIRNQLTPIRTAVIICPVNVLYVWHDHLKRWNGIDAQIVTKGADKVTGAFVIMSFDQAKKHWQAIGKRDLMIVDEAAKIKNAKTERTKIILGEMAGNMLKIWLLSGTPLPNGRPIEIWPILARFAPKTFPKESLSWWQYAKKYAGARKGKWGWDVSGATNLPELHLRLRAGFMMRRKKLDVMDQLPRLTVTIVPVEGDKALLDAEAPYRAEYVSTGKLPKVKDAGELAKIRHKMGLSKVEAAIRAAEDLIEDGQKAVIFVHHIDVGEQISAALECDLISGSVGAKDRAYIVKQFQTEPGEKALVLNAAGQEGITLTAASNVLLVEADWVPGNNEQRIGRCWRFGQTEPVTAQFLTVRGSLDEHILRQNLKKQGNIDAVIDGGVLHV